PRAGIAALEFDVLLELRALRVEAPEAADPELAVPHVGPIRTHRQAVDLLIAGAPRHGWDLVLPGLAAARIQPAYRIVHDVREPDPSVPISHDVMVRIEGDVVHPDRVA